MEVLLNKGKREAAAYVQAECARSTRPENLHAILDSLLDPLTKPIDDWDTIEWCRWLMAGGCTPDEFSSTVRRYDNATTCGLVWTANFVAYRCRTCGISPCMSLCAECFQRGNHKGHDFNMFRSQAGGACDCGDTNVMKESGFCYLHGPQASGEGADHTHDKTGAPPDLLCVANAMMPRLILRLIQHMRQNSVSLDGFLGAVQAADKFITMLYDLSSMGAAMRQVMTHALTNPQVYRSLMEMKMEGAGQEYEEFVNSIDRCYEEALGTLRNPLPPTEFEEIPSLQKTLVHRTFLQELVFWTAKFEFPQKIVCLLLNLLPDAEYKEAFTRAFVLHYSRISQLLVKSQDPDMLSNRVVHVSVQLFSNEKLALRMTEQMNLLHVMVISLHYMMHDISINSPLHEKDGIFIRVVDCGNSVMKDHCYWPLVSDLNNILSHRPVAIKFLEDDGLLQMWFHFLSMFQGMNLNQREMNQHIEFEPTTYYAAFSAELEASASPMWALVSHLRDASTAHLTKNLLWHCKQQLRRWLEFVKYGMHEHESLQVSFHLPLHRYFAVFLYQAVRNQGLSLSELLPSPNELKLIILHPLRVQVAFYEIISGLWVRNGLQIKGQAMTYIQCHFCNSMVDADLFLLQVGLMNTPRSEIISSIFEKFHIVESLSVSSTVSNTYLEPDQEMQMMENCLIFLATLATVRTAIGMSDADLITLEMVTLLCMGDKTHSQLMELMPERCGNSSQSKDFEAVLAKVANYKAPNFEQSGNMLQGMYVPKSYVWDTLYDPIYILLRAVHRRDFQTSMDRFTDYAKQSGKFKSCSGSPWPPFRLPGEVSAPYTDPRQTLLSRVVQSVLFVILYKSVHTTNLSDQLVALTVYLLELALSVCDEPGNASALTQQQEETYGRYDMEFETWFASDNLLSNLRTEIDSVLVKSQVDLDPSDAVEVSVDEMDVESYDGESEMLDIEESGYGAVAQYPSGYGAMDTGNLPRPSGALALMPPSSPPTEFQNPDQLMAGASTGLSLLGNVAGTAMVPALTSPAVTNSAIDYSMHQRVMEVVLAATKGNTHRKRMYDRGSSMGGNQPPSEIVINESMISLLLKLHSKLSCTPDSYFPFWETPQAEQLITDAKNGVENGLVLHHSPADPLDVSFSYAQLYDLLNPEDSRIGDGAFFVKKILDKICAKDELCRRNLIQVREKLWPRKAENEEEMLAREEREKEGRRRVAKERQSKLMAEFAKKQQQFMEKAMTKEYGDDVGMSEGTASDTFSAPSTDESQEAIKPIEYDCVICNQTSASSNDNPVGLVILLQPSSLLGHRTKQGIPDKVLPTTEEEYAKCRSKPEPDPETGKIPAYVRAPSTMAAHFEARLEIYKKYFDESSWLQSMSSGWEGGVHVSTCGHHIHMECLKGYLNSLKNQQRVHNISVERGEYLCPLCRQLANSFLPLSPEFGIRQSAIVKDRKTSQTPLTPEATVPEIPPSPESNVALEVLKLLREYAFPNSTGKMMDAMTKTMEEMTNVTHLKYRQVGSSKNAKSIALFVTSIARTNLELELIFRGGHLVNEPRPSTSSSSSAPNRSVNSKRSCIVPLLHVLGVHYKILSPEPCAPKFWERILGIRFFPDSSLAPMEKEVPILLRDPVTILLHLMLQLPMHVDLAYYTSMVQGIYNLVYIQILCALSCSFTESEREEFKSKMSFYSSTTNSNELFFLLGTVIRYLEKFPFYPKESDFPTMDMESDNSNSTTDQSSSSSTASSKAKPQISPLTIGGLPKTPTTEEELETRVENLLLPYLRIASLLRHHIYEQELPIISSSEAEFRSLAQFLSLGVGGSANSSSEVLGERRKSSATKPPSLAFFFPAHSFFSWISPTPLTTIWTWCEDLSSFIGRAQGPSAQLVRSHHTLWNLPRLMELPNAYDIIFQLYHRKQCYNCNSVPKDPNICLVCGALVCMRDNCCKSATGQCEGIQHSTDCGAGTVMYLSVNSSTIVVVRGRRACLWGSVYLDSFGEEDRELKRGKPLFLSKERYALLQHQWLSHRFDHTARKWIWHRDTL